jgi:hypothetical protein
MREKLMKEDCFNPTMVRLLPGFTGMGTGGTGVFQSHNGAIAAGSGCGRSC